MSLSDMSRKEHCKVASVLTPLAWTRLSFYRPSSRIFIDVYSSLLWDRHKISSFVKLTWRQGDVTSCRERANRSADEAGTSMDLSQTWNNKHIKFFVKVYVNLDEQFHDLVLTFGVRNKKRNLFTRNDLRLIPVFLNELRDFCKRLCNVQISYTWIHTLKFILKVKALWALFILLQKVDPRNYFDWELYTIKSDIYYWYYLHETGFIFILYFVL